MKTLLMSNMRILLPSLLAMMIITSCSDKKTPFLDTENQYSIYNNDRLAEKQFPYEDQFILKNFPDYKPDVRAWRDAREAVVDDMHSGVRSEGQWVVQGPGNIGARINCIAVNPNDSNEILVGYSSGGVFRTRDNGLSWQPIFDDQPDLNIGDITYDPMHPNVIYVGTGDPNISGYPKIGSGLFKSVDGGDTWSYKGLQASSIISRIHVDPTDPNIIYVSTMGIPFIKSTSRGVFKSKDGGDSWEHKLMISDSVGVIDMIVDPNNSNVVYAAGWNRMRNDSISIITGPDARIHKSIDGGNTWTILTNGLPISDNLGRIGLAMSGTDSDHIYASYVDTGGSDSCSSGGSQFLGLWESKDGGSNWTEIDTRPETGFPCNALGGFAWYFGQVRVNPMDDDDIFILGVDMWRTRNSGVTWERAVPLWSSYKVHADKHDLVFEQDRFILATDGGLYASVNDAIDWLDIENIAATQFYRVGHNPYKSNHYYGGAQDNGTTGGNESFINDWPRMYGGDGFQIAFDPSDSLVHYAESQNGNIVWTKDGGNSYMNGTQGLFGAANWDMPYIISYHDPKVLYTGRDRIFRAENTDTTLIWSPISVKLVDTLNQDRFREHNITAIDQSALIEDILYAGTSDGMVWSSLDGGDHWNDISSGIPFRYISSIKASPNFQNTVYLSITGYKSNDFTPYIYRSDDNGQLWYPISGNLPQIAVNDILVLPGYGDMVLFAATDGGIYYTIDGGLEWTILGYNMPIIEVYDLVYNPENHQVVAATFARGIQTFDLDQISLVETNATFNFTLNNLLKIYPTLATNEMYLEYHTDDFDTYYITDMSGRKIVNGVLSGGLESINVAFFHSGMYVITVSGPLGAVTKQFVKL